MRRFMTSLILAVSLVAGVAACSASEPLEIDADTVIIDVRTPQEFAEGHLEGAVNIDVQSADFDASVQQLDPDGEYVVYCRSGNRSAAAIDRMTALGFSTLVDAGSLQNAATSTGLPIVTP